MFMVINRVGFDVLHSQKTLGLYNKMFSTTLNKLESIGSCIPFFIEQSAIYEFDCLDDCGLDDDKTGEDVVGFKENIQFKNFGLTINEKVLLSKVSLEIKKGEKVAIFGKNGCGKSSLMTALLRFIDYEGDIIIDGKNVKEISVTSQRSLIAYVPQNPQIMEGTILENLKFGNNKISNDTVLDLCKAYKTHNIFKHFENGYSTNVGESGKFLSGGQKQQLSFMRAVIKDSDIYLIDEPTSNLDKKSEFEMLNLVFEKMTKKTVIAIIHNPKFLEKFDKILGVHDGVISVYTSYDDFLMDKNLY
jgi:ABC-type multidrug transport system fused ATPase/permease subunit